MHRKVPRIHCKFNVFPTADASLTQHLVSSHMRLPVAPAKPATGAAFIPPVLGGIFFCPFSTSLRIPIALALSTAAALWIWSWICIRRPWGKKQWGWGAFLSAQRTQRVPRAPTVQVVSLYSCKPPLSSQPNWGTRGRPKAQGKAGRALHGRSGEKPILF